MVYHVCCKIKQSGTKYNNTKSEVSADSNSPKYIIEVKPQQFMEIEINTGRPKTCQTHALLCLPPDPLLPSPHHCYYVCTTTTSRRKSQSSQCAVMLACHICCESKLRKWLKGKLWAPFSYDVNLHLREGFHWRTMAQPPRLAGTFKHPAVANYWIMFF